MKRSDWIRRARKSSPLKRDSKLAGSTVRSTGGTKYPRAARQKPVSTNASSHHWRQRSRVRSDREQATQLRDALAANARAHRRHQQHDRRQVNAPAQITHRFRRRAPSACRATETQPRPILIKQIARRTPRLAWIAGAVQNTSAGATSRLRLRSQILIDQQQEGVQLGILQGRVAHWASLLGLGGLRRLPLGDRLIKILEGDLHLSIIQLAQKPARLHQIKCSGSW